MAEVIGALDAAQIAGIRAARQQQVRALRAGDWDTFAQAYDANAIVMPPNTSPLESPSTIRAFLQSYPTIVRIDLTELEIDGRVDLAYERGRYDLMAGGVSDQGSHFTLRRKQSGGSWKIYRDMWHSDRPA